MKAILNLPACLVVGNKGESYKLLPASLCELRAFSPAGENERNRNR